MKITTTNKRKNILRISHTPRRARSNHPNPHTRRFHHTRLAVNTTTSRQISTASPPKLPKVTIAELRHPALRIAKLSFTTLAPPSPNETPEQRDARRREVLIKGAPPQEVFPTAIPLSAIDAEVDAEITIELQEWEAAQHQALRTAKKSKEHNGHHHHHHLYHPQGTTLPPHPLSTEEVLDAPTNPTHLSPQAFATYNTLVHSLSAGQRVVLDSPGAEGVEVLGDVEEMAQEIDLKDPRITAFVHEQHHHVATGPVKQVCAQKQPIGHASRVMEKLKNHPIYPLTEPPAPAAVGVVPHDLQAVGMDVGTKH